MQAAEHVMRYLAGTKEVGLTFGRETNTSEREDESGGAHGQRGDAAASSVSVSVSSPSSSDLVEVRAYADADWGGDTVDRKSTTGYMVRVHGCAISWQSKRQHTVALSTAEAEYMALSTCLQEVKWIHALLTEVGLRERARATTETAASDESIDEDAPELHHHPLQTILFTDNRAAKSLCSLEGNSHPRTKHIDMRHHFIREAVQSREVRIEWIPTGDQQADALTKALDRQTFQRMRERMMTCDQQRRRREEEPTKPSVKPIHRRGEAASSSSSSSAAKSIQSTSSSSTDAE